MDSMECESTLEVQSGSYFHSIRTLMDSIQMPLKHVLGDILFDTIIQFLPSMRIINVSWIHVMQLELLKSLFIYSNKRGGVTLESSTERHEIPKRLFKLNVAREEEDIYIHLFNILHMNDSQIREYVRVVVRECGDILPLLELARYYHYMDLADICRENIGSLVRALIDQGDIETALTVTSYFTNRRNALDMDGSFEKKSSFELYAHPVMRNMFFSLRIQPSSSLAEHVQLLAMLPTMVLVHLTLFSGIDHNVKRHIFAEALIKRARWLKEKLGMKPVDNGNETNYDEIILGCSDTTTDIVIEVVHAVGARILDEPPSAPPTRTIRRSNSDEYSTLKVNQCMREERLMLHGNHYQHPTMMFTRPRSHSHTHTHILLPPLNLTHELVGESDSMDIDGSDSMSDTSHESISDFSDILRQSEVELSQVFPLSRTKNPNIFVSSSHAFHINVSRFHKSVVRINGSLDVKLRFDTATSELIFIASLGNTDHTKAFSASFWIEWDLDPLACPSLMAISNSMVSTINYHQRRIGDTAKHSIVFRGSEPIELARYRLIHSTIPSIKDYPAVLTWPDKFQVCASLRFLF